MEIPIINLIFFVRLINFFQIVQGNEFVTLWAQKTILKDQQFSAVILPTKLQGKTEVALQFRNFNLTKNLESGKAVRIEYPDKVKGSRKEVNLIMTLHVDERIDKNEVVQICSTKSLKIKIDNRAYHTFIQTDKPIYKPGDEVKIKVLALDRSIKPFHMNNIAVDIIDPLNRSIAHFDELDDPSFGVFEGRFNLSTQTVLGDWTIQVVIDRSKLITLKRFAVQKYTFPLFDVFVDISDQHVLASSEVTISFYAKYPFGEFVTGSAELNIIDVKNRKSYLKHNYSIDGIQKLTYKLSDLNLGKEDMELEAVVTFTEPESTLSYKKSARFFVHTDMRHKIVAKHPEKFLSGQLFTVKIIINDWKDQRVAINSTEAILTVVLKVNDEWNRTRLNLELFKGIASEDVMVPKEAVGLKIKIEFLDSEKYEKTVILGNVEVGINDLEVYHLPKFPKLNQTIDVYIKSDRNFENLLAVAMTRYGPVKSGMIKCRNETNCQFNVTINAKMMPESTIIIYHLKDHVNVFLGKTVIETENLGANYLNLKLSSDAPKPKEQLKMSFSTKSKSKIHLLAFDKRLKSLKEGNDITRNDLFTALADYDKENFLLIDDMTSWHECTEEELNRVDKGRKAMNGIERKAMETATMFALKGNQHANEIEDDDEAPLVRSSNDYDDEAIEDHNDEDDMPEIVDEDVRKNFPDSWIFETIEVGNTEEAKKTFTVPDSMTSWDISAFSINLKDGLAIMKPQELTVKNEFFIKVNLPYSIRYKEVLKLDVLIYNYVESYEQLQVTFDLKKNSNFQVVRYSSNCTALVDQNNIWTALVQPMQVQKVSFYIQAGSVDSSDFEAKMSTIKLLMTAIGTTESGITYKDIIEEELRVEPIGLRLYDITDSKFYLDKSSTSRKFEYTGADEYSRFSAIVSGDYLSDVANLESMIEIFSSNLEDKALRMKESYEAYRFLFSKGQKTSANFVNTQYQNIMSVLNNKWVKPSVPFRIVFADTLASLMKIRAITINKAQILEYFDAIETEFFDYIGIKSTPWFQENIESEHFKVAFALIPLIKHSDLLSNSFIQLKFFFNTGRIMIIVKNYIGTIEKGMNYLKNNEGSLKSDAVGLSITAYVHALYGKSQEAQKLIVELEKLKIDSSDSQKCFKLKSGDTYCNNLVTAYTALTYMKLNKTQEAKTIFNWLVESNPLNKFTFEHAILTEAIAEIGINLKFDPANLKIKLENKLGFQTVVNMKGSLSTPKIIDFPEYTQTITTSVTGNGFCSVTILSERLLAVPQKNPKFNITIETDDGKGHKSERTVKVCAVYQQIESDFYYISDVFYEIELPSGYVYNGYIEQSVQNVMEVQERRKGTVVSVYFHEFELSKLYCVNIKATKLFIVKESHDAAVRVYDYSDKASNIIQFYRFSNQNC
ncbi:hypothetical protein ACKWTF_014214 [Chironomus riparius]